MKITTIKHGQSVELINEFGLKRWYKFELGTTLDEHEYGSGNAMEGLLELKMVADNEIKKLGADNTMLVVREKESFIGDDKIDIEFEEVKINLYAIDTKEEAAAYLDTTDFKHTLAAKNIVNSKTK